MEPVWPLLLLLQFYLYVGQKGEGQVRSPLPLLLLLPDPNNPKTEDILLHCCISDDVQPQLSTELNSPNAECVCLLIANRFPFCGQMMMIIIGA